jgi:HSP20 family protein
MSTLSRWDPLGLELPSWIDRLLDEHPFARLESRLNSASVRIEEFMDGDTLVVRAEIPDVDVDKDVDISVHDGLLHIKAERRQQVDKQEKSFYRSEFRYGALERAVPLPPGTASDDVKATYEDGVIEIRVPTPKALDETTKVPIQRHS